MPTVNPASTDTAARVDTMGRRILAANPGIGGKPMFTTIGAPQSEVFHRGMTDVFVTEGLVRECTDEQLAAVLCLELAKMVREREAATPAQVARAIHCRPSMCVLAVTIDSEARQIAPTCTSWSSSTRIRKLGAARSNCPIHRSWHAAI